jgi:hypothetical protein
LRVGQIPWLKRISKALEILLALRQVGGHVILVNTACRWNARYCHGNSPLPWRLIWIVSI